MAVNAPLNRKLRMGLVGGGRGSFIGRVHHTAAVLDNRAELVAGALSSDPQRARESAADYDISADRAYGSFLEMIDREQSRPERERIDFVTIATPNHTHFAIAQAACEAGLNVFCDKPMTLNLEEAEQLFAVVEEKGVVFALTHNYTGYPLVRQARAMVRAGELGEIRAVRVSYFQGRRRPADEAARRRLAWRSDPAQAGVAGCFGDIGTHAFNLARYTTGLFPEEVSCSLKIFEEGRQLDDYGHAVVRFEEGVLGTVTAGQVSHGRGNDLSIEIDGSEGAIAWRQEEPNQLILRRTGRPQSVYTRDPKADYLDESARAACRLPAGHPEGFFEAFANIYRDAFDDMVRRAKGQPFETTETIYPNVHDGVEGMYFIRQCVTSSSENGAWKRLKHNLARR